MNWRNWYGILLLILIGLAPSLIKAQKIDSLQNLLGDDRADTSRVNLMNKLAFEYAFQDPIKCKNLAERALSLAQKLRYESGRAFALKNLGVSYMLRSSYDQALEYFLSSLKVYEEIKDLSGQAKLLNNAGMVYIYLNQYQKALDYNFQSIKINEKLKNTKGIAYSYDNVGKIYTLQKDYFKARMFYNDALKLLNKLKDDKGTSAVLRGLGEIEIETKQYDKALELLGQSLNIDRRILNKNGMALTFLQITRAYFYKGKFGEATEFLKEALKISQTIGAKRSELDAYALYSEILQKQREFEQALRYYQRYTDLKDSLFSAEKQTIIKTKQEQYDREKQARENAELKQSQQKIENQYRIQQTISIAAIISLLLILGLVYVMYRSNRHNSEVNKLLKEQRQDLLRQKQDLEQKNEEIESQRDSISFQNKQITDSIRYAQNIQQAMLPFHDRIARGFRDFFVLFRPRDLVSGDFYWYAEVDKGAPISPERLDELLDPNFKPATLQIIAAVDCTGHGVPGAFMSMIGHNLLNEIVNIRKITSPEKILHSLHLDIRRALKQDKTGNDDGMDVSICVIDRQSKVLQFAGAKHPLIIIQNDQLREIRGTKKSIGGFQKEAKRVFKRHDIDISQATSIYLFSDGYSDQLGGEKRKKFMRQRLRELIDRYHYLSMREQQEKLNQAIDDWMGANSQVDDILVIGLNLQEPTYELPSTS